MTGYFRNRLLASSIVGLITAGGTLIAISTNIRDYRLISMISGCSYLLGLSFIISGKPLIQNLLGI